LSVPVPVPNTPVQVLGDTGHWYTRPVLRAGLLPGAPKFSPPGKVPFGAPTMILEHRYIEVHIPYCFTAYYYYPSSSSTPPPPYARPATV